MATLTTRQELSAQRDSAGTLWLVQSILGLLVIALLGLHMVAHHFIVEGGLRGFDQVIVYVQNPVIFVIEVAFLITVTVHALLGVRSVIMDLGLSGGRQRLLNWTILIVGGLTLAYGLWLAVALQAL